MKTAENSTNQLIVKAGDGQFIWIEKDPNIVVRVSTLSGTEANNVSKRFEKYYHSWQQKFSDEMFGCQLGDHNKQKIKYTPQGWRPESNS